jgi:TrwC relaxase
MLSIYVISADNSKDENFYTSLADENFDCLVKEPGVELPFLERVKLPEKGIAKVDFWEEIRCSSFRERFYQHHQSPYIPPHACEIDDLAWSAVDFMFCAPKSVSMALHLEGDSKVFEAHDQSVKFCLDFIEKEYAATKIDDNGPSKVIKTGNIIAALFNHPITRYGEMEIHTHAIIMNNTYCPDGKWRSLHLKQLLEAKWIGNLYLNELICRMKNLGYRFYETDDGVELKGYTKKDIQVMSKRSQAILQKLTYRNRSKGFG